MTFLAPERLLLFIPVALLAVAYVVMQHRRRRYAVRFTNLELLDQVAPNRPGWRRHVTTALAGLAAMALVVGLAQPTAAMTVASEEAIVMLAIDTSTSMEATDVVPSRISAAITEATAFVEDLPEGLQVGLVAFDGTARLVVSPTGDHDTVVAAIANLTTDRGTAGGDAIETSLDAIAATLDAQAADELALAAADETDPVDEAPPATIVMLSDGETTVGTSLAEATQLAVVAQIPVSTITYGSALGTVSVDGQTVPVPPASDSMAELAAATGGETFEAQSADQLGSVYEAIDARVATTTEQRELTLAFVSAGFVFLVLATGAAFVWSGRFL